MDEVQDLSLLIVPGRATSAVHNAMVSYCEIARDGMVFAILDPPANQSATDVVTYVTTTAALQELTEYAAIYWPRVEVLNPAKSVFGSADKVVVPPSGIIAGVYARTDGARPGGVYDPPAGIEKGVMFGVLGFETSEVLEEPKRDLVYPKRINPLTTGSGLPRFIDGSRTLKSSGNFPYVAERRGVIFIERSLKQG
ncbi:MAG: phage tail sheath subtilisin-like domain-containing protein, partial [Deltaproteobacteria bacterium]|nr:phage tail sheath subtilisin-like domain-containing protein [Deltaproteobacteria bacterium]